MKPSLYHALKYLSLALVLSTTGVSAVSAADSSAITPQLTQASEAGHVELSEDELSYKSIHQEVVEAMDKLEESGGGMKPLRNYLAQIDNAFEAGDQEGALKKLNSLKEGVDRQLANVKDIKERKPNGKTNRGKAFSIKYGSKNKDPGNNKQSLKYFWCWNFFESDFSKFVKSPKNYKRSRKS